MDEREFERLAEQVLQRIEHALDGLDSDDVDVEVKEGGVLEIELPDRSKIVINRHGAAREIWIAARVGGFHFRWDGATWRDTRHGEDLFGLLSRLLSSATGRSLSL